MEKLECGENRGLNLQGSVIKDLRFADDTDLLVETEGDL